MKPSKLLIVDSIINLALGVLLIVFPATVVEALGLPMAEDGFYRSVLGGVLVGIGVALLVEYVRLGKLVGLGLCGAVCINLCDAAVLAAWLIFGNLSIPARGHIVLWSLVAVLVGISTVELSAHRKK